MMSPTSQNGSPDINLNASPDLGDEHRSKKSKKSKKGSKRGTRSSSAKRRRNLSGDESSGGKSEGEEGAGPDHRPDFEAEEVSPTRKPRFGGNMPSRVNKKDLFKPISQIEREKREKEFMQREMQEEEG
jgi:hypothetical protein